MLKRLMIVIAFLLPLVPLLVLPLLSLSLAELTATEYVTPLTMAQLHSLPDGQVRVVNGDYDLQNPMTAIQVPSQQGYSQLYTGLAIDERVTAVGTSPA